MKSRFIAILLAGGLVLVGLLTRANSRPAAWLQESSKPGSPNEEKLIKERLKALESRIQGRRQRLDELEKQVKIVTDRAFAEIDRLRNEEWISGEWFFDYLDPQSNSVLTGPNKGIMGRSRTIRFHFPRELEEPPAILICINMINFKKMAYAVNVKNVTTKGFDLYVESNTFWQHMRLTWVAIPNPSKKKAAQGQVMD